VDGVPTSAALESLSQGVPIGDHQTLPCRVWLLEPQPNIPPRDPPIRVRKTVSDCWIGLELTEGKNRQVRKMTAAVGHPTLRLIRVRIGRLELRDLPQGQWRELNDQEKNLIFKD
jgi:23S rRNA pseudouridine2457 synthase